MIVFPRACIAAGRRGGIHRNLIAGEVYTRCFGPVGRQPDVSSALEHAAEMLQSSPYASQRAIVNIVGDGEDNVGEDPRRIRDALVAHGVVINGVVIGGDPAVITYFRNAVVGPSGFVLAADKPETLSQVFALKFMSEIAFNLRHTELPDRM